MIKYIDNRGAERTLQTSLVHTFNRDARVMLMKLGNGTAEAMFLERTNDGSMKFDLTQLPYAFVAGFETLHKEHNEDGTFETVSSPILLDYVLVSSDQPDISTAQSVAEHDLKQKTGLDLKSLMIGMGAYYALSKIFARDPSKQKAMTKGKRATNIIIGAVTIFSLYGISAQLQKEREEAEEAEKELLLARS